MRYLFSAWDKIAPALTEKPIWLFLDYDGTLAPIVRRPELAKLAPGGRNVLTKLAQHKDVKTIIISGRSLEDVKKRVNIRGLTYVGNHGLQIQGPETRYLHPSAHKYKMLLRKIISRLKKAYRTLPGIIVENKTFTASIHYRQLAPEKVRLAKKILLKEMQPFIDKSEFVLRGGKKVWELRPCINWNKGKAVLWLLKNESTKKKKNVLPIYIGDDLTDEDAFKVLKRRGIGIRVTENAREMSKAHYYLLNPVEVIDFLGQINKLRKTEKESSVKRTRNFS